MPGFPILHYLPEFSQTYVCWVSDAIQPSHPLSPPSLLALNVSQHQGLFQIVHSLHQVAKDRYRYRGRYSGGSLWLYLYLHHFWEAGFFLIYSNAENINPIDSSFVWEPPINLPWVVLSPWSYLQILIEIPVGWVHFIFYFEESCIWKYNSVFYYRL